MKICGSYRFLVVTVEMKTTLKSVTCHVVMQFAVESAEQSLFFEHLRITMRNLRTFR
jgi:hypothetical protein